MKNTCATFVSARIASHLLQAVSTSVESAGHSDHGT